MKQTALVDRQITSGMRNASGMSLTKEEIALVEAEIEQIHADRDIFIFNDEEYLSESTCYNFMEDRIYITSNVLPNLEYGSTDPRDWMSIRAVLAHEYYGHRIYQEEYLADAEAGNGFHTIPPWQDECRASLTAAGTAYGLNGHDRFCLIMDAISRAEEAGFLIQLDEPLKNIISGKCCGTDRIMLNEVRYIHRGGYPD